MVVSVTIHHVRGESSTPYKLGIEGPGLGDVVGPLDDRAAVGEDGELVAFGGEAEHEGVVPDLAERGEPRGELGEVQGLGASGGHLHGVAAAERGRVRPEGPVEPLELATPATGAVDLAEQAGDLEAAERPVPEVDHDQLGV